MFFEGFTRTEIKTSGAITAPEKPAKAEAA